MYINLGLTNNLSLSITLSHTHAHEYRPIMTAPKLTCCKLSDSLIVVYRKNLFKRKI
jgi:hypothetical protein